MIKFEIVGLKHRLSTNYEMLEYSTRMNEKFNVQCQFYGEDEMLYSGSYENVLLAVIDHYQGDASEAFVYHPELEIK